ncbi:hypothetical protein ABZS95_42100 [Streptomyces sp. NPDC005479]|uniref:hypothetical protein n=1 Tax=unclassified Streptomyces TaxID=2593676 RepID=UPI0033A18D34
MGREISKLKQVRAVGIPAKAFTGIGVQVISACRARASAASPSHLRRFDDPVRHVLLAAPLFWMHIQPYGEVRAPFTRHTGTGWKISWGRWVSF